MPNEKDIPLDSGSKKTPATEKEISTIAKEQTSNNDATAFSATQKDLSGRISGKTSAEDILNEFISMSEADLIPWEEVSLPSRGLYYGGNVPNGLVRVKAMGAHADKILATARLAQTGQSIDYLFEHCVQIPNNYSANELLAGDRVFLLYVLRGITHGNIYEFMLTCPQCSETNSQSYDLNELAQTITLPNPSVGDEPFKVVLPYLSEASKKEIFVRVRFLRGKDISRMAQRARFKKKVAPAAPRTGGGPRPAARQVVAVDETLTENLNLIVTDFMGEVSDPMKIKALIERLHSSDTAAIREFLRSNSPGIDTTIQCSCASCGGEFKTELPITESFFRPTQRRGI